MENLEENDEYLTTQIITYIGNKRSLLGKIEEEILSIKQTLNKEKLRTADVFSGSGIVSRMLKKHSEIIFANDLENYSKVINTCYLTNKKDFPEEEYSALREKIISSTNEKKLPGIITENYAPDDDQNIQKGERVFYTKGNALLIDTYRNLIEDITDPKMRSFFLAPLLSEASIHVNTSGVFKGFYKSRKTGTGCFGGEGKNALTRILGTIELKKPILSNFESQAVVTSEDALTFAENTVDLDIAYLDPPYNQHPYGSNYFMLNNIVKNKIDSEISVVSGIPKNWNRSVFNKPKIALSAMENLIDKLKARFIIISYNSEGFISFDEMTNMLQKYGSLKTKEIPYNTFRGSRNLNKRSIHVKEYLFILKRPD